jgi:acyl carrier protein
MHNSIAAYQKKMFMSTTIMPPKSEIDSGVKRIIIEKLGIEDCEVPDNALFTNDLGIDSLDLYEIFMEIEREFKISIPDEDAENLRTVGSVILYIKTKK